MKNTSCFYLVSAWRGDDQLYCPFVDWISPRSSRVKIQGGNEIKSLG